ncbi:hypothetical protein EVAR_56659_1 [Eumeta japonica]|uniref:Peptidase A1 domain-containing protein n=1 Tax=Eumeta variegata TaxID=151549 RepID=A0A4C1ZYI8_EUMVA|nr:hypothetical protein EVAR_56659_1 [Eumeta japonica]
MTPIAIPLSIMTLVPLLVPNPVSLYTDTGSAFAIFTRAKPRVKASKFQSYSIILTSYGTAADFDLGHVLVSHTGTVLNFGPDPDTRLCSPSYFQL